MSSERKLLSRKDPWWGEHHQRYLMALDYIKPSDFVLDIACGTGYGTEILSHKANKVVGGDIDTDTINKNISIYSQPNLSFSILDGTRLPFESETFDVLISFETIEHTINYLKMLNEFKRVVKKGGMLIISTPNRYLNSPNDVLVNKYHTQEWTPSEFQQLITSIFGKFEHYGQEYIRFRKKSFIYSIAHFLERLFYLRGIRKIPLAVKDWVMKILIQKTHYPEAGDYEWIDDFQKIEKKCVTQIAVIKKS